MSKVILAAACLITFLSASAVQAKTVIIKKGHDHHRMMHHPMRGMMHHDMHR